MAKAHCNYVGIKTQIIIMELVQRSKFNRENGFKSGPWGILASYAKKHRKLCKLRNISEMIEAS